MFVYASTMLLSLCDLRDELVQSTETPVSYQTAGRHFLEHSFRRLLWNS
jgi:hypothetical protein